MSTPPGGYVCRICNIPGHWTQQCPLKYDPVISKVPSNYICNKCGIPGHWIQNCPNNNHQTNINIQMYPRYNYPNSINNIPAPNNLYHHPTYTNQNNCSMLMNNNNQTFVGISPSDIITPQTMIKSSHET